MLYTFANVEIIRL